MLKNITFSAEEHLIQEARKRAARNNTTLNDEFRRWLAQYVERPDHAADYALLLETMNYARPGRTFTREEMNER